MECTFYVKMKSFREKTHSFQKSVYVYMQVKKKHTTISDFTVNNEKNHRYPRDSLFYLWFFILFQTKLALN